MNGKAVQKRPIAVDWAVERSAYEPTTDTGAKLGECSNLDFFILA